jgi:hypothetical protein
VLPSADWQRAQASEYGNGFGNRRRRCATELDCAAARPAQISLARWTAIFSGATGAGGGFVSGFLGHVFGHALDEPVIYPESSIRPALLLGFSFTFSVLIASVLGFTAIAYMGAHRDSQ